MTGTDLTPSASWAPTATERRPAERPSTGIGRLLPLALLGVGLGAFVDGIVLHQILQWHHLLTATGEHPSTTVAGLEANTLADGLFHATAWVFVLLAAALLLQDWRQRRPAPPPGPVAGSILIGWAVFNLVEGLVNHHLLGIHNVRDDIADPAWWNAGFLLASVALLVVGALLVRAGRQPTIDLRDATDRG